MNAKRFIFLFSLCFFFTHSAVAQNFQWLRNFGTKNVDQTISVCAEDAGNSVMLHVYGEGANSSPGIDTVTFDTFTFIASKSLPLNYKSFLIRLDSAGKVKKVAHLGSFFSTMMCKDDSGNFYVACAFPDTILSIIGSVKLKRVNGGLVVLKFNKDFIYQWSMQTGNVGSKCNKIIYSGGHLIFIAESSGSTPIGNSTYNFTNSSTSTMVYGELNTNNGSIIWSNYLYDNSNNRVFVLSGVVSLKNKLYFSGRNNTSTITVNGDPIYKGGFVIETDSAGNYKKNFPVYNRTANNGIDCIATDGEYLYIGGVFTDSIIWNAKKIKTGYIDNFRHSFFIASITSNFTQRWFFKPSIPIPSNLITGQGSGVIFANVYNNKYLYFAGTLTDQVLIDSQTLGFRNGGDALILKVDLRGNILWATAGGGANAESKTLDAKGEVAVFTGGTFLGNLKFGPFKQTSKWFDGWITKISDNAIIRGPVKYGPYCAGDSIKIPYTKLGDYDTSNIFIAQLSNEFGNFDSAYHTVGSSRVDLQACKLEYSIVSPK